jgi:hypothetical protein
VVEPAADEGLVRYIKERFGEGYNEQQVRQALLQAGHSEQSIDAAFGQLRRFHGPKLIVPFILLLLIAIGVVLYLLLLQQKAPPPPAPLNNSPPSQPAATGTVALAEKLLKAAANQSSDQVYYATVQAAAGDAATVADGILLCSVNKELTYRNYCLQQLAEQRREAGYCEVVGDAKQRDDCYLALILKGEDQYCAKLLLDDSKRVCTLLGA